MQWLQNNVMTENPTYKVLEPYTSDIFIFIYKSCIYVYYTFNYSKY